VTDQNETVALIYIKRNVREECFLLKSATDVPDAQEGCGGRSHLLAFRRYKTLALLLQRPSSFRSHFWRLSLATMSISGTEHIKVPAGYKLHTENSAHLLLPDTNDAFLNPIQEFNRDLSVACIRVWAEERDKQKKARWLQNRQRQLEKESASKRRKCLIFRVINR